MNPIHHFFICLSLIGFSILPTFSQCNGFDFLCDQKYNEVAYLTTHNAYNSEEDGFLLPNQHFNITSQLNAGVRGLMIDVYEEDSILKVYHGYSSLGSAPFTDVLAEIKSFLEDNPNEIVSLILESYTTAEAIGNDLTTVGLNDYLYAYDSTLSWPSLQTMIDNNERLVIFSESDEVDTARLWHHPVWNYAVETHYSNGSPADFSCDYNRGNPENDLFILNHFITNGLGVGDVDAADTINLNPYFIDRVLECQEAQNKFPNFVVIDFYELGDGFAVVDSLNKWNDLLLTELADTVAVVDTAMNSINTVNLSVNVLVYPNPSNNLLTIKTENVEAKTIQLLTNTGKNIITQVKINEVNDSEIQLNLSDLTAGIYFVKVGVEVVKILHLP